MTQNKFLLRCIYLLSFAGVLTAFNSHAQIINTIAGNGTAGYAGDGLLATTAEFNQNTAIVFDARGNLYVSDAFNNRIRVISKSGIISTFAGTGVAGFSGDGGPATAAKFNEVISVFFDHIGNMYVSDCYNYRIRKIDTTGIITTFAGNGSPGYTGDGGPATNAELNLLGALYADEAGNIYIATYDRNIRKIDTAGIITTFAGGTVAGYSGDGGPATAAELKGPLSLAQDAYGNFYITDQLNNCIRKVDTTGIITTVYGTGTAGFSPDGTPATTAQFNYPMFLFMDGSGNMYFTDINNARVREIDNAGILHTIAGDGTLGYGGDGGPAIAAEIGGGCPMAMDCAGNIILSDIANYRIRKITYTAAPAFAGGPTASLSVCENTAASIDTSLSVVDTAAGIGETWGLFGAPAHGVVAGTDTVVSTGSLLTPSGYTYTPATGYTGADTFSMEVYGCSGYSMVTVYVTVSDCALQTATQQVSGASLTVCPNPNEGSFGYIIHSGMKENVTVVITDMVGEQVATFTALTNTLAEIQLNVPSGIYYLSAVTAEGCLAARVVVCK